jgi:hypothetical protein
MRSKIFFLLFPLLTINLLGGCAKKLDSDQVLVGVSDAMCKKMVTCQPNAVPNEEPCKKMMKEAKEIPKASATQAQLDTCLKSIAETDCAGLLGEVPPKNCEFLK